jgi:hypothetical protein
MKKRPINIHLKNDLRAHLIFADNGYNVDQPAPTTAPSEVWEIDKPSTTAVPLEGWERVRLAYSRGQWSMCDTNMADPLIASEIVEKRNSLPSLFMTLNSHLSGDLVSIDMHGNLEANRSQVGIMTILPNERYPAEVWTIREKKIGLVSVSIFTLYYDEGTWNLWMENKMYEQIVLELGLQLVEKRNALSPSGNDKKPDLVSEVERFFRPFKVLLIPSKEKELLGLIEQFAKNIGTIIFGAKDVENLDECFDMALECPDFEEFFKSFEQLTLTPDSKDSLGGPLEFFQNPLIPNTIDRYLLDGTRMLVAMLAIAGISRQTQVEPWLTLELTRWITRGFRACTAILAFLGKETFEDVVPREIRIDRKEMEALFEEIKQALECADLDEQIPKTC